MILHKILRGDQAGLYLPFALARLKQLERINPAGFFQQKFVIGEYRIEVEQAPPFQYVRIVEEGGVSYEFFTSEHVSDVTLASPGHAHGIQFSYVCGSATRAKFNAKKGTLMQRKPLYSTALDPGSPPRWNFLDCESPQTKDTRLWTWRSWQNQKFAEHCWHPNNDGKALVTSTQAQVAGWANQSGLYSPYCYARFANIDAFVSDYTLDIPPTYYSGSTVLAGAPQLEHGWLYWRRAAVQSAGGRKFFIATDNYGRFQVYPVKDYGTEVGAIPPTKYKMFTPPYPAWVSVPNPSDFTKQFGQWLWRFNKDATKCVSIPFHSQDTDFLKYLDNDSFFCAILPETSSDIVPSIALAPAHEDTPGLVEFGIQIDVIGDGDMDFNVTFTLLRNSYFNDTNRFFFDAAYFLKDVENIGIAEDTLITAEIQCKTPTGYFSAGPLSNGWATEAVDACRQMQADVVINANSATMVPTEKLRFPAIGPAWFQFPTIQGVRDGATLNMETQSIPTTTGTRDYSPAGPGVYDPDGVIVPGRMWNGPLAVGVKYGYLFAMELSTLSVFYETDDEVAGTVMIRALAYGKEFYRYDGSLGYTLPAPTVLLATDAVPSFRAHQAVLNFTINTDFGEGFSVHPAGHWAFNLGGIRNAALPLEADLDWISVFKGVDKDGNVLRARFRHKDLFDHAFAQTRDYSFYHESFPERSLGDYGSFRTAGIWATFR